MDKESEMLLYNKINIFDKLQWYKMNKTLQKC